MYDVPVVVKDALRSGAYKKNYRFLVLNDDGTTDFVIDNDNLVSESVSIDERMCSGDTLKYGLCEGSSLEFQYFGKPNITGRRVQVFIDALNPYEDIGEIVTNVLNRYTVSEDGDYRIYINPSEVSNVAATNSVSISHNGSTNYYNMDVMADGHGEVVLTGCTAGDIIYLWNKYAKVARATVQKKIYDINDGSIPMGFFDVKSCSRQASTGIIKASCYNKLMSDYLDADASMEIANLESDCIDSDYITFKSLQSMLLSGYTIQESQTLIPAAVSLFRASDVGTGPTFKLNGSSTTYYPKIEYEFVEVSMNSYNRIKLDIDKYLNKLITAVNGLKNAVVDNVQSGSTFWENFKNNRLYQNTCGLWTQKFSPAIRYGAFNLSEEMPSSYDSDIIAHGAIDKLQYYHGFIDYYFYIPVKFYGHTSSSDVTIWTLPLEYWLEEDGSDVEVYEVSSTNLDMIEIPRTDLSDVTLRELMNAYYELRCQYGQLSRVTDLFSGVELNHSRLLPADTLYPADSLYPDGAAESAFRSQYSKLWADEGNVHKWRYLIITYKGLNENNQEAEFTLQRTVNADGTDDYNMSDNWLFKNLVWTASDVGDYADAMVLKMQDITWFPFEMWCAGLPYLETGDEIEIPLGEETYTSYILQRQLNGIQNLQDTYINGTLDIF